MAGWMIAASITILAVLAASILLVRLDRRVEEELRLTDEDWRWISNL